MRVFLIYMEKEKNLLLLVVYYVWKKVLNIELKLKKKKSYSSHYLILI